MNAPITIDLEILNEYPQILIRIHKQACTSKTHQCFVVRFETVGQHLSHGRGVHGKEKGKMAVGKQGWRAGGYGWPRVWPWCMGRYGGSRSCVTGGQMFKTTTPTLVKLPPPPVLVGLPPAPTPPPPAQVVIVCALKDGVEALNDIRAHSTQPNAQAACIGHGLGDILLQIEPPCNNVHGRCVPPRPHVGPRGAACPCTTPEAGHTWAGRLAIHHPPGRSPTTEQVPPTPGTTHGPPPLLRAR